jgi:2-polyprenyl-3-methyl-5-hydroxy-6-metoxy-1,4-benzoquinol methylase
MSSGTEDRERDYFERHYEEAAWHPLGAELRLDRDAAALLRRAGGRLGRVLSVGCGDGSFECRLSKYADSVLGIDLSRRAIERVRERAAASGLRNLEFRCTSLAELPANERFDTIVCLASLHHVPEAELPEVLARLHRQLVPGGFVFARDPSLRGALRALGRLVLGSSYHRYHSPDERELDPYLLDAQLRAAGFASVEIGWLDFFLIPGHYMFPRAPGWLMRLFVALDRVLCATPLARWASGFTVIARRSGAGS